MRGLAAPFYNTIVLLLGLGSGSSRETNIMNRYTAGFLTLGDDGACMTELDIDLVLVPVDGSEESHEAVDYAIAIAREYGARVHALYVLDEDVVRAIETGAVDEADIADDTESFTDSVIERADAAGVPHGNSIAYGFSTKVKTVHPGSVVLDTAEEIDADFIVVPREPVTGGPGEVLEKAAEYVLLYASQPVLSV
ncbi:Nucleotide-binding universal stress protein, UspA family [Halorubrum vacuolatum]|uniref:Nucleotide-binding universal stress protein, UspA family n=2 Tax=Halorubrum vacuolatum TaxID=63740 RepID=A0A238V859_HALVU|nr:Nucleotide-binding universal stress protein, UspA family [Halorubrum vacuolatum]